MSCSAQLIVRLRKYSLGRADYRQSVHWQRGLVLDDDYNGRALLEAEANGHDIRITVRAAWPQTFLSALTSEVRWLAEDFWEGLRCELMVPCLAGAEPGGNGNGSGSGVACGGLFKMRKLFEIKKAGRTGLDCSVCDRWQEIDALLRNAPAAPRGGAAGFAGDSDPLLHEVLRTVRNFEGNMTGRFDKWTKTTKPF